MKRDRAHPLRVPTARGRGLNYPTADAAGVPGKVLRSEKWLVKRLLATAGNPPINVSLWNGDSVEPDNDRAAKARLHISDRNALLKLVSNPDLQFGELFAEGRLRIDGDLEQFITMLTGDMVQYNNRSLWARTLGKLYLFKRNTRARAKDNIHHHYDLGNEFYQLWLDQRMLYTCAYFPTPEVTLEQAQLAKMDHVARKLQLQPGEQVVEAGCGWGALALHLAQHYGVKVRAYNISKEQLAYARQRAAAENLTRQVEFIEGDYREIDGEFDAFVSVGMLEHVGAQQFGDLGSVIDRGLRSHGRGLIHSIGRNRPAPMNAWIERRIFPGAYPPSPGEMANIFEPFQLSLLDMENLRLHYAFTLRHWLQRFDTNAEHVKDMFDETFVRTWRLYLAGSASAFAIGELQLFQVLFSRHNNNVIPMTRNYLYPPS